jgi:hypothetical protein
VIGDPPVRHGDDVVLPDGREGQVWIDPHPEDWMVTVAVDQYPVEVPRTDLTVVRHQLPDPQPKDSP